MFPPTLHLSTREGSLYDRIGDRTLKTLVSRFYGFVALDPQLTPIFPPDLTETAEKQLAFLTGFLGGPPLYQQRYGHPRLRARHLPFPITPGRAQAWLSCMRRALQDTPEIHEEDAKELFALLTRVATHMVNTAPDEGGTGETPQAAN